MDRAQAIEPIMQALERYALGSRELLEQLLGDWSVVPYELDGVVAACAVMKGPEIHFAVSPTFRFRLLTRDRIRTFLAPLLAKHGYLTTRMLRSHGDAGGEITFVRRLGFRPTWTADDTTFYMLTKLPFERGSKCRS